MSAGVGASGEEARCRRLAWRGEGMRASGVSGQRRCNAAGGTGGGEGVGSTPQVGDTGRKGGGPGDGLRGGVEVGVGRRGEGYPWGRSTTKVGEERTWGEEGGGRGPFRHALGSQNGGARVGERFGEELRVSIPEGGGGSDRDTSQLAEDSLGLGERAGNCYKKSIIVSIQAS